VNGEDGTFEAQIPGDRPVRLSARHPLLACASPVETTAGIDGVVLRLVEGPTLSFRLPGLEESHAALIRSLPGWQRPPVRLRLSREGTEPLERIAIHRDGAWRAGGFARGRYDVWIDVPAAMPQLLRGRELKEGANDLGDVQSLEGSRIRVRLLVRDGFAPPTISLGATHLGEPAYQRLLTTGGGQGEATLSGLGPGRFRVTGGSYWGMGRGWIDEEVDLDGANEVGLVLDLR
jgi:hypothetical protein